VSELRVLPYVAHVNPPNSKEFESNRGFMGQFHQAARLAYSEGPLHSNRQNDEPEIKRARQAAEALFAPKRLVTEPAGPVSTPSGDQEARKPRILRALGVQPTRAEEPQFPPIRQSRRSTRQLAARNLPRVRTWLKYGMTVQQAAKVCGVSVGEIERVLRESKSLVMGAGAAIVKGPRRKPPSRRAIRQSQEHAGF
jgi:hypothetical protein